ncbi:MAG: esterase/lipase family protein [Verrucomicrobiales bacterium]
MKPLRGQPLARLGRCLDAANAARLQLAADPENSRPRSDYNFAVARIVETIEDAKLTPWEGPLSCKSAGPGNWSFSLKPPDPRPEYHPWNFHFLAADRYTFKGKLVSDHQATDGLGAPMIVIGKDMDFTKSDPFAQGKNIYYGFTAIILFDDRRCKLVAIDPLEQGTVSLDKHRYLLASDFQAPLALAMAQSSPRKMGLSKMFKPDKYEHSARLARLQVYNPDKIPVIFIHGLGDSQATWTPMIDFLRHDQTLRDRYQFWIFSYPTGLPYALPAASLRRQLDRMKDRYPNHKNVVIVAHSLGGNIARLFLSDSGMTLWDTYFDRPPEEIPFHDETRRLVVEMLIFKARSDVSRIIFASASLRGSNSATGFWGRLGAKLIGNPIAEETATGEALTYVRPEIRALGRKHLPNSIDLLDPESLFLKTVNNLPIKSGIPYHSIIGDRGKGGNLDHTKPVSTDGIVPYWSSHLDGALSERIIPSEHWSILHPLGMEEVKRILLEYTD